MRPGLALALLLANGCTCARLDPGLIFECGPNGECEAGLTCTDGFCVAPGADGGRDGGTEKQCEPTRHCSVEECGEVGDDGCGHVLDCGACGAPFTCGLLEKNRCGCVPFTSPSQVCPSPDAGAVLCGSVTVNNCGTFETFVCGPPNCGNGQECSENMCCAPPSDAQLCVSSGFRCGRGEAVDRCGTRRVVECGMCSAGSTCLSTDEGSQCVSSVCAPENDAEFCNSFGVNCGTFTGADHCGQVRVNVRCGDACDAGGCSSSQPFQCACQPVLAGCRAAAQCCSGLTCGSAGLCCVAPAEACSDDSDCCGSGTCAGGACCSAGGVACASDKECCSGVCGVDGGCAPLDAGSGDWDGGEL